MAVRKKRSLIEWRTPFCEIPRAWLQLVEPRIIRPSNSSCWLWTGALDVDGRPVIAIRNPITGKRNTRRVARVVAEMFWELRTEHEVLPVCRNLNCLNPAHLHVSDTHWTQENRGRIKREKQNSLKKYEKKEQRPLPWQEETSTDGS